MRHGAIHNTSPAASPAGPAPGCVLSHAHHSAPTAPGRVGCPCRGTGAADKRNASHALAALKNAGTCAGSHRRHARAASPSARRAATARSLRAHAGPTPKGGCGMDQTTSVAAQARTQAARRPCRQSALPRALQQGRADAPHARRAPYAGPDTRPRVPTRCEKFGPSAT